MTPSTVTQLTDRTVTVADLEGLKNKRGTVRYVDSPQNGMGCCKCFDRMIKDDGNSGWE